MGERGDGRGGGGVWGVGKWKRWLFTGREGKGVQKGGVARSGIVWDWGGR